ncbi:Stp1/IreP family PP2C-type Ser/Thr phosphatase [Anabaena cylindrica FACHB-243]|uniref:Protein serine/threonine phosphatase n=1 Tax=Anabaena cylindrica (strain ATCC 27899 / PCC 7122) TaxID=272123 RepID=K9Z9Z6_ANACC|nr:MULTISPECIES: Stp1/IreP family PP2C-type Ser/Thr phosphatase [Anabaena]AFZ56028.1 protein serine/threonine phosphatase [Anabaena cylindrica PCC 7122]MBD2419618.1 Stp1/IreP family PP2C-type Ser/Thr phosphatase [Anabaena cylindrica FACHB-243]MBY5284819.1 Stp1/IreP family PP2C-type Ser/Thr phosphatase [Anabaena sp. CCAP 1446/1C]MBY5308800.1 Stp1/IreP family PP2C-type Ser/Thr phosphatase [Anabaena sp. CCAP 1446/1C]MCM2408015.1 Stp1/IreP family PP2C-type Ser/Thr phosphatase [Anabaena sp. CCAP 14
MKLNFTGCTDPGLIRANNQDAYYIDPEGRFFIVADGMGGHAGGEEASRIATQQIQAYLGANWQSSESAQKLLEQALLTANKAILQDQQNHPERSDMGTTAVVVVFPPQEQPLCAHIGDSRLYRLRESKLEQITEDHTWIARAIKIGDISVEEARLHPYRHVLSRCLGREDFNHVDIQALDIKVGDRLLLCSDGLTEELVDQKIFSHLQDTPWLDKAAFALVEAAKEEGGHDNITIVLVAIEENS